MIHATGEFASLRNDLLKLNNIEINIAAESEHVPEIEREIRTVKERNRTSVSSLPFEHYPRLLKCSLISNAVLWFKMFPHADDVSKTMSPQNIIIGTMANYDLHCSVPFGAYCKVHNVNDPRNTEKPRIALHPTVNLQGSDHFLSHVTGNCINRQRWTELPITVAIIARVHELALSESDYDPKASNFVFGCELNVPFADDDDNTDHDPIHLSDAEGANHIDIIDRRQSRCQEVWRQSQRSHHSGMQTTRRQDRFQATQLRKSNINRARESTSIDHSNQREALWQNQRP
jgi:hypothetical protein